MIYNASKPIDVQNSREKFEDIISKGVIFELKEKRKRRSISQNSYLHLILAYFALQTGYTAGEVKQDIFKKIVNSLTFYDGEFGDLMIQRWRSTADLSTVELTSCIEKFRHYSNEQAGIYLPVPEDLVHLQEIEQEVENNKYYL